MRPDPVITSAILIQSPDIPRWLTSHRDALDPDQWFITPPAIGRGLGLGWVQAMQQSLKEYNPQWRVLADCGGFAGDAATAIGLGVPGIVFTGGSFGDSDTDAVEKRLASMAEHRGVVFLTTPPPIVAMA